VDPRWIKRIYGDVPWAEWGGVQFNDFRTGFVLPNGERLLFMKVLRVLGRTTAAVPAYSLMERLMTFPNGQVKNFLVACRTLVGSGQAVRICVKGSRGQQGGGLWHRYFALYASFFYDTVVIDFFDPNEIAMEWTLPQPQISCQWFPQVYLGDGTGYDCIIDDAWVPEIGVQPFLPKSAMWSLKGRDDSEVPFVPYLHTGETRCFSQAGRKYQSPCPCMVCKAIGECSESYTQYLFLRTICLRLGHATSCGKEIPASFDVQAVGDVLRLLESNPTVEVSSSSVARAVMALSEEMGLRFRTAVVVAQQRQVNPSFTPLVHREGAVQQQQGDDHLQFPWLRGKRVAFAGVDPSLLGTTPISRMTPAEVVFVKDLTSWDMSSGTPMVYCPVDPSSVQTYYPQYQASGRLIFGYREYVLQPDIVPPQTVSGLFTHGMRGELSVRPGDAGSSTLKPYYYRQATRTTLTSISLSPFVIDCFPSSFGSLQKKPEKNALPGSRLCHVERKTGVVYLRDAPVEVIGSYFDVIWRHPTGVWGFLTAEQLKELKPGKEWQATTVLVPPGSPAAFIDQVELASSKEFGLNLQRRIRSWYHDTSSKSRGRLLNDLSQYVGIAEKRLRQYFHRSQVEFVLTTSGDETIVEALPAALPFY
jgi:hypothetical protein